jgi:hypothetical protein
MSSIIWKVTPHKSDWLIAVETPRQHEALNVARSICKYANLDPSDISIMDVKRGTFVDSLYVQSFVKDILKNYD